VLKKTSISLTKTEKKSGSEKEIRRVYPGGQN
jgi:hypothetical protein